MGMLETHDTFPSRLHEFTKTSSLSAAKFSSNVTTDPNKKLVSSMKKFYFNSIFCSFVIISHCRHVILQRNPKNSTLQQDRMEFHFLLVLGIYASTFQNAEI